MQYILLFLTPKINKSNPLCFPVEKQRLIFDTIELDDFDTIKESKMCNDSQIYLVLNLRGC